MSAIQIIGAAALVTVVLGLVVVAGAFAGIEGGEWAAYLGFVFGTTAAVVLASFAATGAFG